MADSERKAGVAAVNEASKEILDLDFRREDPNAKEQAPGFGWTFDAEIREEIEKVEKSIRSAEMMGGKFFFG